MTYTEVFRNMARRNRRLIEHLEEKLGKPETHPGWRKVLAEAKDKMKWLGKHL